MILYFKNFVYHCSYISEYATHNCDKNQSIFGKYIIVYDSINNKNVIKYLICKNCRKAYFIEHFLNYCEKCKDDFDLYGGAVATYLNSKNDKTIYTLVEDLTNNRYEKQRK